MFTYLVISPNRGMTLTPPFGLGESSIVSTYLAQSEGSGGMVSFLLYFTVLKYVEQ